MNAEEGAIQRQFRCVDCGVLLPVKRRGWFCAECRRRELKAAREAMSAEDGASLSREVLLP
jgi:hypothetical protein